MPVLLVNFMIDITFKCFVAINCILPLSQNIATSGFVFKSNYLNFDQVSRKNN